MNNFIAGTRQTPIALLVARFQVATVRRELQALVPVAVQMGGNAVVPEERLRGWQETLRDTVTRLQQIPVPQIFPPPTWASLVNQAIDQINQVLAVLDTVPILTTLIFPPQPGQAVLSLANLERMISGLQRAEDLLNQAIQVF